MKQLMTIALLALVGCGSAAAQRPATVPNVRAKSEAAVRKYLTARTGSVVLKTAKSRSRLFGKQWPCRKIRLMAGEE